MYLEVSSVAFPRGVFNSPGSLNGRLCLVCGYISAIVHMFIISNLKKNWIYLYEVTPSSSCYNVLAIKHMQDWGMSLLSYSSSCSVMILVITDRVACFQWSKVSRLADCWFLGSFLLFTFAFRKGISVHIFVLISNSEADVLELVLVVCSAKLAKYWSLSSSIHYCWVSIMVWIVFSTNVLLWGNTGLELLCMNYHDLEHFWNLNKLYWDPLSLNTTLVMACCAKPWSDIR